MLVYIRGAGDLASGIALRLHRAGMQIVMADLPVPTAVRRTVCFSEAIRLGEARVEDLRGVKVTDEEEIRQTIQDGDIPVLVDPEGSWIPTLKPDILVDAILAKRNLGTRITDAPVVIGVGPGFTAGVDCHAVVETMRGHTLGRVIYEGSALPNTGIPGTIGGKSAERVVRAPADGTLTICHEIGDLVSAGEVVGTVDGVPMKANIDGMIRGLLQDGSVVHKGMKSGDVDPRGATVDYHMVSDKATAIGGGVLEAALHLTNALG